MSRNGNANVTGTSDGNCENSPILLSASPPVGAACVPEHREHSEDDEDHEDDEDRQKSLSH